MNFASALQGKPARWFLTLLPFVLIVVAWLYFAVLHPIPYWQQPGDYPWYALSQAFTLEARSAGFPASNLGYKYHPGLPFGLASWLALRLATHGIDDSAERIEYAIANAESFWLWAKIIALALTLAGIAVVQRMLAGRLAAFWIACGAYLSAIPAVYGTSLIQLTNESFALLYISLFYYLTFRLLTYREPHQTQHTLHSSRFGADLLCFGLGALAVAGCTIKIYYVVPAFGMAIGLLVAIKVGALDGKSVLRAFGAFLVGVLVMGAIAIKFLMGWHAFLEWIDWNYAMVSHSGRYGSGESGFLKISDAVDAIRSLSTSTLGTFPVVLMSFAFAYLMIIKGNCRDKSWLRQNMPFAAAVGSGILISLIGVLKHYSPLSHHYTLPLCASLSCLLLVSSKINPKLVACGAIAMSVLLAVNLYSYLGIHRKNTQLAQAVTQDVDAILALPIQPDEKRVWGYYSPTKYGLAPMISQYAGSAFVTQVIRGNSSPNDITPIDDLAVNNWRYVMFPKSYFPSQEDIRTKSRTHFDFAQTQFAVRGTDKLLELEAFFVLARTAE